MKKIFTILALATLFVACSKEDVIVNTLPNQLSVSIADDESRVHLNADKKTVWDSGDMLSVFYKNSANGLWRYTGEDGARDGVVTKVSEPTNPSATFSAVYAVYPYNESTTISSEGIVSLTIPTEQTFMNGSYGKGDNIMVAVGENDNLSMKNVFGWVRIPMTGTGQKVSSITFKGNNEEILAGVATIDPYTQKITFAEGGAKELTLNCNDVALAEGAAEFYIAVAPQKFNGGFTVDILLANGNCVTKTTTNPITISRNHICPMSAVTNPHNPKPANNEILYTNGSTTKATVPYKTGVFGANIVSNTYDADKECWVIKFDGEVTWIGDYAFRECTSLKSVTIPDSVISIGQQTFSNCTSLSNVTIPDSVTSIGVKAFYNCNSLTKVTIPDSVTSIGNYAFQECDSLKEFKGKFASEDNRCLVVDGVLISFAPAGLAEYTIPPGVASIAKQVFYYCTLLTSITIPDSVTSIGNGAFTGCTLLTSITIPDSVTSIGKQAFSYCDSLTSVTIPDSVTSIGDSAFSRCTSLSAIYGKFASDDNRCLIIDGVLKAFAIGSGLTEYSIPDSVISIGDSAFFYCTSLKSITIPNGVTSIGGSAFYNCSSLTSITIPDSVTSIGFSAFSECTSLESITIPDSVTSIGNSAFNNCSSLTSITIPDGVTSIGYAAFSSCDSLKSVTIPDSVTSIEGSAFSYCDSLTSITIPDSVTSIGMYAFNRCTSLKEVYCKPTTPPTLGSKAFDNNATGRKIYVPASDDDSVINAYKAKEYWSSYATSIEEYSF